jgi:hypothetical protein
VRSPHHDAFHDSLTADKRGLFAALEDRQHLDVSAQAQKVSDKQGMNSDDHYTSSAPIHTAALSVTD